MTSGDPTRPQKTRFGAIPVCARCRAPVGAVELDRSESAKCFTAASWALMTATHPHPPYNFVPGLGGELAPEGYLPLAAEAGADKHDDQESHE